MPPEGYRICLTPEAERDLEDIWLYTAKTWSMKQANLYVDEIVAKFDLLAAAPFISRERAEFRPPVRVHRHQSHVIIYSLSDTDLIVVRVAHMRQNWANLLGE
jgi:toxin ParE1/3/4